ncbi:MAG: hypothetical protein E3J65_03260 [Dehalococcoidia bacterium]|nr:MAG: hypothetical protein E3J65_03260 [Dehalococcoidia bacterium]
MKKTIPLLLGILVCLSILALSVSCVTPGVVKPTVGYIPPNWSLTEDTPYPGYEGYELGVDWGLITYTDQVDYDRVDIWYGDIPSDLRGRESDSAALIAYAVFEADVSGFTPDETGMMSIDGCPAGYAKAYDASLDVYELEIVYVKGKTCVDVYALYDATTADEAEVMSLINSIHVP